MKGIILRILCVAALLVCALCAAGAEMDGADGFCGTWTGEGVTVTIARDGEALQCRAVFGDGDARDVWAYCACWVDGTDGALCCGGIVTTHERYDALTETWDESDWAMDDFRSARFEHSEDGTGLVWSDDGLDAPVALLRAETPDEAAEAPD